MFLLALLSTDAEACAMAYGGGHIIAAPSQAPVIGFGEATLGDLLASIDQAPTPAERFMDRAPKVERKLPERAPEGAKPLS